MIGTVGMRVEASLPAPPTPVELAEELDALAVLAIELPGVSRTNPHAFSEAKSELAARIRRLARQMRDPIAARRARVTSIAPGSRVIGRRHVPVEVRRAGR